MTRAGSLVVPRFEVSPEELSKSVKLDTFFTAFLQ